jgi:farnesyl diphosphate synthase
MSVSVATQLSDAVQDYRTWIDEGLKAYCQLSEGCPAKLREAIEYSLLAPGKRIRPILVLAATDACGGDPQAAVPAACAVEMIHCYSLVHDDLPAMDDDDLRRGQPSCHVAFDEAAAILAGDALLTLAFQVLAEPATHPDGEVRSNLVRGLAVAAGGHGMVGGQMIDLLAEHTDADFAMITRIQRLKTGALIGFSCEAGAILGGAPEEQRQALCRYAHDVGLAFQIVDDLLDELGTAEDLGKATQKDAAAGKATFVSLLGVDEAKRRAELLADQAVSHLDIFGEKAAHLCAIARFVIERRT